MPPYQYEEKAMLKLTRQADGAEPTLVVVPARVREAILGFKPNHTWMACPKEQRKFSAHHEEPEQGEGREAR